MTAAIGMFAGIIGGIGTPAAAQTSTQLHPAHVIAGSTPVGSDSAVQTVTMWPTATGSVATIQYLTSGSQSFDYKDGGQASATCAQNGTTSGTACTVNVIFHPTTPGLRSGAVVLLDNGGHVLALRLIAGSATGSLAVIRPGEIETVAGNGTFPYLAGNDNIQATSSTLFLPSGVVTDSAGDVYISDSNNNRIRRVDGGSGIITTYAGTGSSGSTGDGQAATSAMVSLPSGLTLDGAGNLYIADAGNNAVRKVDAFTGVMTTVAGQLGATGYTGDTGLATQATLSQPNGIVFDQNGNLYIADTGNNAIRRVDTAGVITTIAGGTASGGDGGPAVQASLNTPWSLAFSSTGILYIADRNNNTIRAIDTAGNISTVAGTLGNRGDGGDGGPATQAGLNGPTAIAVDPAENLYIADTGNNTIRRVDGTTKIITLLSGSVSSNIYNGDGFSAAMATYYGPYALHLDGTGNLYIADLLHNRLRRIDGTKAALTYPVMRVSKVSSPQIENIENDGNTSLTLQTPTFNQSALDSTTTNCSLSAALAKDATCALGIEFAPTQVSPSGGITVGSLIYPSTAGNSPITVALSGQVLSVNPTTTTVTSSLNPAGLGQAVTFTAAVTSDATTLTGTVSFYDGTTLLQTVNLASKSASMTTSSLTLGAHSITAKYSGDDQDAAGTSPVFTENILQLTQIGLTSSVNPSAVTQSVTFTATITANDPITVGTISFYDGATLLGTGTISGGVAVYSTNALSIATHNITASFVTTATSLGSTSPVVAQVVNKASTTTMISATPGTAFVGTSITLTATVMSNNGPAPTGNVTFNFGNTVLGTAPVSDGHASLTVNTLPVGSDLVVATYAGDDSNTTSTSTGITVTINQLSTTTALTSSANPSNAGFPLQLTASVNVASGQTADGAISGNASFYNGSNLLGSSAVVNGVATLSTIALNGANSPYTLTSTYTPSSATANYLGSTSPVLNQAVLKSASTTALTLSEASITAGKSLTMTVHVGSTNTGGVTPTGSVTFADGSGFSNTVTLDGSGNATLSVTSLSVGAHTITATYSGDNDYVSSAASKPVTVNIGQTSLTLTANPTSIQATSTVTFSAALMTNGVLPSPATITLQDNGAPLTTLTLNGGNATFSTASLSVGTHNIVAIYSATANSDANNTSATSNAVTIAVASANTTTTLTTSKNPSVVGDAVTIQATVKSAASNITGTVTFYDGTNPIGSNAVSNGVASITLSTLNVAGHPLKAVYTPSDNIHASSTSAVVTQQVVQPTSVSLRSDNNPAISGTPVNLVSQVVASSASTSPSALPTGTVTYKEGNTIVGTATLTNGVATLTISNLAVGTHNIVANYGGDTLYQASSSAALVETIRNASTGTVLAVSANPIAYAATETFTAHVTGNGGTVTGTVAFLDGTATIGTAQVASNGTAVFTTATLAPGMHVIAASYQGDGANAASVSSAVNVQVLQPSQTSIAVSSNPALTLSTVILTATVRNTALPVATGTVTFSDGATTLGTATLNAAGVATLQVGPFSAGTHSITASYGGDVGNRPSVSSALSLVVQLRPTQTALSATAPTPDGFLSLISAIHWDGPAVPTGVVTFSTSTGVIGTSNVNSVGVATLNITSSAINGKVTATYSGDASYSGSSSPATTIQLAAATNFTIALNPTTMSIQTKQYVVAQLTVTSINGFTDTMNVGCLGLPKAATCVFDKNSVALTSNGSFVVKVTVDTGSPLTAGGESAELRTVQKPGSAATTATLAGLPVGALLGFLLLGRRKRKVTASLLILLLAVCLMPMFGCGTIDQVSTPPGTYTFAVSAVGQNTGITLSQNITLTVTQ